MEIKGLMIQTIQLLEIKKEAANTYTYKFSIPQGSTWEAGTNAHLVATGSDTNFVPSPDCTRHLSICSLPNEGYMGFSTRIREGASLFKQNLRVCNVGDKLHLYKLVNRLPLQRKDVPVVLVSMGVGIATFRPMILAYAHDQIHVSQLVSINIDRTESSIYKDELEALDIPNFKNSYVHTRATLQHELLETKALENAEYHIVGSDEFLLSIGQFLIENGISAEQIMLDKKENRRLQMLEAMAAHN